jgi:hypothetical protein
MKLSRMLGLAVLAALALMVSAGAGTASAGVSKLCQVNISPCPTASVKGVGTKISATAQNPTLKAEGRPTVACEKSTVAGEITEQPAGGPTRGKITSLTFTGCVLKGVSTCTVNAVQLPYTATLSQKTEQNGNGILSVSEQVPNSNTQPGATVICGGGFFLNCTFKVKEANPQVPGLAVGNLQVTGGNPATVSALQVELKASGPNCMGIDQAFWDVPGEQPNATPYVVTQPAQALFVTQ